jgi:hypothetical protein
MPVGIVINVTMQTPLNVIKLLDVMNGCLFVLVKVNHEFLEETLGLSPSNEVETAV